MALGWALMAYSYIVIHLELKRGKKRQHIVETKNMNKLSETLTKKDDVTGIRAESNIGPQEMERTSWG